MRKVSIQLLHSVRDNGVLLEFSVFLSMRWKFKNGILYKSSQSEMADKMGMHRNTFLRYVKKFQKLGWVVVHNGNYVFLNNRGLGKLYDIERHRVISVRVADPDAILKEIHLFLLSEKHRSMLYSFRRVVKGEITNEQGRLRDGYYENFYYPYNKGCLQISYEGLGGLWGMSKTNAFHTMQGYVRQTDGLRYRRCWLDLTKDLGVEPNRELIANTFEGDGSVYVVGKRVIKNMPNTYYWD